MKKTIITKYSDFVKESFNTRHNIKTTYFGKVLIDMYGDDISSDFVKDNYDEIEEKLIARAKINLNSKPDDNKLSVWKHDIKELLDFYIEDKFNKISDEESNTEHNRYLFKEAMNTPEFKEYIYGKKGLVYDIFTEMGYENVKKYVDSEISTTYFPQAHNNVIEDNIRAISGKNIKSKPKTPKYSELEFLPNDDNEDKELKNDLLYFFMRRVVANIPTDVKLNKDDVLKWMKTYTYKFIFEYANKYKDI
jgi:hypothetical protein